MSIATNIKYPEESIPYSFDFSTHTMVADNGESLSSNPTVSVLEGPPPLTLGTPFISGTNVSVNVSGGQLGNTYFLVATVQTDQGNTIAAAGKLKIAYS